MQAVAEKKLQKVIQYSQPSPKLGNQYLEDQAMLSYLQLFYEQSTLQQRIKMEEDLARFGSKVTSKEYLQMAANAEDQKPWLEQFDAWGKRVDTLHTSEGWRFMKKEAAIERLIQIPYKGSDSQDPDFNPNSRLHQIVKLMLFNPSSGLVSCPLAMTDGAAFTFREMKRTQSSYWDPQLQKAFDSLTSSDPSKMWTSGQWMTEKRGGSDVTQGTDTFALEDQDKKRCYLYGYKWFSSATDSDMSLALARFPKSEQEIDTNEGKLAMVFLKIKDKRGRLNNIEVVRLKDKLGTRQLPTAELVLRGTEGIRISDIGAGVKTISNMLTLTRIHNSLSSVAAMRRMIALANDYKERRVAFGKKLSEHQLHIRVIADLEKTYRGNLLFVLECASLLQRIDHGNYEKKKELRLMNSVLKLFTAKEAMRVVSEGVESFGGLGYMENSRIPQILRDAQVLPIWEGTTNILSLDFAKDIFKNYLQKRKVLEGLLTVSETQRLDSIQSQAHFETLKELSSKFLTMCDDIAKSKSRLVIESQSRILAMNFAHLIIPHIFLRRVMPGHYQDAAEVEVFSFWMDRLKREFREALDESSQQTLNQKNQRLLRGQYYGKDIDEFQKMRHKL